MNLKKCLFIFLVLIATACGPAATQVKTFDRVKQDGVIRVGFANEKPFAFATESGELSGEAVTTASLIFQRLGIPKAEGVLGAFGTLIPGLKASRFDAVTAGMFIKPERCKEVVFSNPHFCLGQGLAVKAGNPYNLHSYEDIAKNPKVKIGAVTGGYEEDYLKTAGVAPDQIVIFPDHASLVPALQAGRIDAFTLSGLSVQSLLDNAKDPGLERASPFTDPVVNGKSVRGCGGTAFRLEDVDLRDAYNAELKKMADSGELLQILKSFGFSEQELPDATAEQLCKAQ